MNDNDLPTEAPVEHSTQELNTSTSTEQVPSVSMSQDEYDDIVMQLEKYAAKDSQEDVVLLFSKVFWDHFFTKIIVSFASVKIWILLFVLYVPAELVKKGYISGDNYTNILIIVAPLVVGMREFSKVSFSKKEDSSSNPISNIVDTVKKKFKI